MKKIFNSFLIILLCLGSTSSVYAGSTETYSSRNGTGSESVTKKTTEESDYSGVYTYHEWNCIKKINTNVKANEIIESDTEYSLGISSFNDENNIPDNCVGKEGKTIEKNYYLYYNGGSFDGSLSYNSDNTLTLPTPTKSKYKTITKYSHTNNISDDGTSSGYYSNNEAYTNVVTIPGAESLSITVTYSTESTSYDWVSIFSGSHSDYTAASNYLSADIVQKLGGSSSSKSTATYTVQGDSVTFAWRSDGSQVYYGYYAVITATVLDFNYDFVGWTGSNGDTPQTEVIISKDTEGDTLTYTANWKQPVIYGYATVYKTSSTFVDTAPDYYTTATAYYWKNYEYRSSSYDCNCSSTKYCCGSRVAGNGTCPGDNCEWREDQGGCWWHEKTCSSSSCSTCYKTTTANCGWTTKTSISAAGCTTKLGVTSNGTQSTKTVYFPITSWASSSIVNCGSTQCGTKSATTILLKSLDNGSTWVEQETSEEVTFY